MRKRGSFVFLIFLLAIFSIGFGSATQRVSLKECYYSLDNLLILYGYDSGTGEFDIPSANNNFQIGGVKNGVLKNQNFFYRTSNANYAQASESPSYTYTISKEGTSAGNSNGLVNGIPVVDLEGDDVTVYARCVFKSLVDGKITLNYDKPFNLISDLAGTASPYLSDDINDYGIISGALPDVPLPNGVGDLSGKTFSASKSSVIAPTSLADGSYQKVFKAVNGDTDPSSWVDISSVKPIELLKDEEVIFYTSFKINKNTPSGLFFRGMVLRESGGLLLIRNSLDLFESDATGANYAGVKESSFKAYPQFIFHIRNNDGLNYASAIKSLLLLPVKLVKVQMFRPVDNQEAFKESSLQDLPVVVNGVVDNDKLRDQIFKMGDVLRYTYQVYNWLDEDINANAESWFLGEKDAGIGINFVGDVEPTDRFKTSVDAFYNYDQKSQEVELPKGEWTEIKTDLNYFRLNEKATSPVCYYPYYPSSGSGSGTGSGAYSTSYGYFDICTYISLVGPEYARFRLIKDSGDKLADSYFAVGSEQIPYMGIQGVNVQTGLSNTGSPLLKFSASLPVRGLSYNLIKDNPLASGLFHLRLWIYDETDKKYVQASTSPYPFFAGGPITMEINQNNYNSNSYSEEILFFDTPAYSENPGHVYTIEPYIVLYGANLGVDGNLFKERFLKGKIISTLNGGSSILPGNSLKSDTSNYNIGCKEDPETSELECSKFSSYGSKGKVFFFNPEFVNLDKNNDVSLSFDFNGWGITKSSDRALNNLPVVCLTWEDKIDSLITEDFDAEKDCILAIKDNQIVTTDYVNGDNEFELLKANNLLYSASKDPFYSSDMILNPLVNRQFYLYAFCDKNDPAGARCEEKLADGTYDSFDLVSKRIVNSVEKTDKLTLSISQSAVFDKEIKSVQIFKSEDDFVSEKAIDQDNNVVGLNEKLKFQIDSSFTDLDNVEFRLTLERLGNTEAKTVVSNVIGTGRGSTDFLNDQNVIDALDTAKITSTALDISESPAADGSAVLEIDKDLGDLLLGANEVAIISGVDVDNVYQASVQAFSTNGATKGDEIGASYNVPDVIIVRKVNTPSDCFSLTQEDCDGTMIEDFSGFEFSGGTCTGTQLAQCSWNAGNGECSFNLGSYDGETLEGSCVYSSGELGECDDDGRRLVDFEKAVFPAGGCINDINNCEAQKVYVPCERAVALPFFTVLQLILALGLIIGVYFAIKSYSKVKSVSQKKVVKKKKVSKKR